LADEQQQSSEGQAPAPEAPAPAAEQSNQSTPEDIEAYWRNRQSGSDKAHSEETRVLREQLAVAQAAADAKVEAGASSDDVVGELRRQNADLQQQVKQTEAQRLVDTRRAMYPAAAEALADNQLVASMDEGRLAALNVKLTDEANPPPGAPLMDGNNPARPGNAPPKRLSDMSADELKGVMEQGSAQWLDEVRRGGQSSI